MDNREEKNKFWKGVLVGALVMAFAGLIIVGVSDAVRTVSKGIEEFQKNQQGSLLVITHSTRILESLHVDVTHVLADGKMILSGDSSLVEDINENGFEKYIGHQE